MTDFNKWITRLHDLYEDHLGDSRNLACDSYWRERDYKEGKTPEQVIAKMIVEKISDLSDVLSRLI